VCRNGARPWRTGRRGENPDTGADRRRMAAMEPVLGGRDDVDYAEELAASIQPQWSPSLADGTTFGREPKRIRHVVPQWSPSLADGTTVIRRAPSLVYSVPQWSPSLADGTTRVRGLLCARCNAAMEPVLGGRDDRAGIRGVAPADNRRNGARPWRTGRRAASLPRPRRPTSPQWSPSLADGTTVGFPRQSPPVTRPQWSPSLADGTTWPSSARAGSPTLPQWSPSLADGTTRHLREPPAGEAEAAMEPVLGGRDDRRRGPSFRRAGPCRNGARPWRTGRPCGATGEPSGFLPPQWSPSLADGTTSGVAGVKGEQLEPQWSPSLADGTTVLIDRPAGGSAQAAMEPVLGGRDDADDPCASPPAPAKPQWSPSLADGTTPTPVPEMNATSSPQWSPSLADGTTVRVLAVVFLVDLPQWSPSLADGTTWLVATTTCT